MAIFRKLPSVLHRQSLTSYIVARDGLGKDIWTVPFENVTKILYVSLLINAAPFI